MSPPPGEQQCWLGSASKAVARILKRIFSSVQRIHTSDPYPPLRRLQGRVPFQKVGNTSGQAQRPWLCPRGLCGVGYPCS